MEKVELRTSFSALEVNNDDTSLRVHGIVNKPGEFSHQLGSRRRFVETIEAGVFQRAIDEADKIDFLANHDTSLLLASTTNNSLKVYEIDGEVRMEAEIAPTTYGQDIYTLMQHGLCNEMSFAFTPKKDRWEKLDDGTYKRYITDMKLFEVTVCRNGAYPQSQIAARNLEVVDDPEIPIDVLEEREEEQVQEEVVETPKQDDVLALLSEIKSNLYDVTKEVNELKEMVKVPTQEEVVEAPVVEEKVEVQVVEQKVEVQQTVEEVKVDMQKLLDLKNKILNMKGETKDEIEGNE